MVNLLQHIKQKKEFQRICRSHDLRLDYSLNRPYFSVWSEVFIQRCYADYFPFYQQNTILDVRAHVGAFALFAGRHSQPGSRIFALEPSSDNFNILQKNLRAHAFPIEAQPLALSSYDGEQSLHLHASINHSLVEHYTLSTEDARSESVKTCTLDSWLADHRIDHLDFLKLDCEGSEYAILEHASSETLQKITTISMEFHDMKQAARSGLSLVKLLEVQGFHVVKFMHEPTSMGLNYGKIIATRKPHG